MGIGRETGRYDIVLASENEHQLPDLKKGQQRIAVCQKLMPGAHARQMGQRVIMFEGLTLTGISKLIGRIIFQKLISTLAGIAKRGLLWN
jgi:hypothetical protein